MTRPTRRMFLAGFAVPAAAGLVLALDACAVKTYPPAPFLDYPNYYYDYYYYPNVDVYYHLFSGDYFYRRNNSWYRTRSLPPNVWLNQRYRFQLHTKTDRPYEHDKEYYTRYAKPKEWQRDKNRSRRDQESDNRRERQHNLDQHIEYHRRHGD
jgi:hypothetical protein